MAPAKKKPRAAGYITKTSSIVCMSKSKMAKSYKTTGKAHFVDVPLQEFNRLHLRCDYATREPKQKKKLRLLI